MIEIADYQQDFLQAVKEEHRLIVVYGAGTASRIAFPFLPDIFCYCDKNADSIVSLHGKKVIKPQKLSELNEKLYILVCVNKKESTFNQICKELEKLELDLKIFNYFNNIAFNCYLPSKPYEVVRSGSALRVRLVSYDKGWILNKFAVKLEQELKKMGVNVDVAGYCDPEADINHHISHHNYEPIADCGDTLMITHVDCKQKIELLKHQLETARLGICMSEATMNMLAVSGIPREKLCYINPAQDGVIRPKKYILGITHKTHVDMDYRKNPRIITEICKFISPDYFSFKIMGAGWREIVEEIINLGFDVDYYENFDYDIYVELMPQLDYYLYYGNDEGSMGYLDALRAGIKTIVTPQGYHLDVKDGITYSCETVNDFIQALLEIQKERETTVESIKTWTWENYARKHLAVWNYLMKREPVNELMKDQHYYKDGIFSMLLDDIII